MRHGQSEKRPALRQKTRLRAVSFTLEDISRRLLGVPVSSTLETDTVNHEKAKRSIRALTIITWSTKSQRQLMSNFVYRVRTIWHCSHMQSESKLQYYHLIYNSSQFLRKRTLPDDSIRDQRFVSDEKKRGNLPDGYDSGNVDISRPPKAIQSSENERQRKCHSKQDPRYSFENYGRKTSTHLWWMQPSLSYPCSSPLSVVILKEESRTPSLSLPSDEDNLRGWWSVNVTKKVGTSLIGAFSKCIKKWTINLCIKFDQIVPLQFLHLRNSTTAPQHVRQLLPSLLWPRSTENFICRVNINAFGFEGISVTLLGILRKKRRALESRLRYHYSPIWSRLCHHWCGPARKSFHCVSVLLCLSSHLVIQRSQPYTLFRMNYFAKFSPFGHSRVVLCQVGMLPHAYSSYAHLSRTLDM